MKQIVICLTLLLSLFATSVWAQELDSLHIILEEGSAQSASLVSIEHITFETDKIVLTTSEGIFRLSLSEVDRICFSKGGTSVDDIVTSTTEVFKRGDVLTVRCGCAIHRLYLVDMTGKVLLNQAIASVSEATIHLPSAGVMVLFLETSKGYVARKIVN
jgi:hypothetical protein